jgi:dienelactone hydrolase
MSEADIILDAFAPAGSSIARPSAWICPMRSSPRRLFGARSQSLKPGAKRSGHTVARRAMVALLASVTTLAGCGSVASRPSPKATTVSFPNTPAGRQARWLVGALAHLPIPAAQIAAHFDRAYLAIVPAPAAAALNASFVGLHRLRVDSITTSTPTSIEFIVTVNGKVRLDAKIEVDSRGLMSVLHTQQAGNSPPALPVLPSTSTTTPATSNASGVRQIPVGVGSPPLRGALTLPAGKGPFPAVVLVSGSGPNDKNETLGPNHPFLDIALGLAAKGIASVRYDKRTQDYPRSINQRTFTLTQEYVPDALAAIRLLQHQRVVDPRLIFVLGHSQGGTYAPLIAKRAPEVAGVILLAAGAETLAAALERQVRYLATLPGATGANAKAQLPDLMAQVAEIDNPTKLEKDNPTKVLLGGAGPAYYLSGYRYNEVATARALPQPLLLLQGDRDYQVTVANDLDVWLTGLLGRKGMTVVQFAKADHLLLDGTGPPTPVEYQKPSHVDPKAIGTIAAWIDEIKATHVRRRSAAPRGEVPNPRPAGRNGTSHLSE